MAAPDDHPEIAKLADDITIPTALLTQVCELPIPKLISGQTQR